LGRQRPHEVYLELLPGESCLVQTSDSIFHARAYPYYQPAGDPITLKGEWKIEFISGGPRLPATVTIKQLGSWTNLDGNDVKVFSGTAKYSITFPRPGASAHSGGSVHSGTSAHSGSSAGASVRPVAWMLELGKVDVTAQVFLNGNKITTLIGPDYRVIIPAADWQEKNMLEIRVSNKMANRIEDMDRQGIPWKKFYNTNFPAHERANRGANGLFDASKWAPLDSGLSGPVTITPLLPLEPGGK
jgi:hypothetical protein